MNDGCGATSRIPFRVRFNRMRPLFLLAASFFLNSSVPAITAPSPPPLEYEVKAAFLLNFTKFVEWPAASFATADAPLSICILGDDPFGRMIDQLVEGESVNGHKIAIERIRTDQPKSCQVLYFADSRAPLARLPGVGSAVLTVGEGDDFIRQGGVIAFVLDSRRVRFDISLKAAANSGLKLSSRLLTVARTVDK